MTAKESDFTDLLTSSRTGGEDAARRLFPLVYDELRRRAGWLRRGDHADNTLTTTALVHEAYLKLVDQTRTSWQDRAHFLAVASIAMRQILVDHARERGALKRGGDLHRVDLDSTALSVDHQATHLLELDEALTELAAIDARLARVVECRFFGGLTEDETAEALGVTARTVRRDWTKAKALLYQRLRA